MFRYLLGDLPESEHEQFEDEYFGDDEIFAQLRAAEDELVDRYLNGELSRPERERFEQKFLCSDRRRRKVEAARALLDIAATRPQPRVPAAKPERASWWQALLASLRGQRLFYGLSAATLLLAFISAALVWEARRLHRRIDRSAAAQVELQRQIEDERARNRQLNDQRQQDWELLAQLQQQQTAGDAGRNPVISKFSLDPSLIRDPAAAGGVEIMIPAKTRLVQLQVKVGENRYSSYQATLSPIKNENNRLWSQKRLKARKIASGEIVVDVWLPAGIFEAEDYSLRLDGLAARGKPTLIEEYPFTVVKR